MLQRVMLSEDEDSESEISDFDVFDEANDMEEGYRSMHKSDSDDDDARSEESEEGSNGESNEQGMEETTTVNAMHTKPIHLHTESGPSGSRAGVGCGRSRRFQRGTQLR